MQRYRSGHQEGSSHHRCLAELSPHPLHKSQQYIQASEKNLPLYLHHGLIIHINHLNITLQFYTVISLPIKITMLHYTDPCRGLLFSVSHLHREVKGQLQHSACLEGIRCLLQETPKGGERGGSTGFNSSQRITERAPLIYAKKVCFTEV